MELRWPFRIAVVLLLLGVIALLWQTRVIRTIEAISYDLRAQLVGTRIKAHEDIVIVAVDDESLAAWAYESNWPWKDWMMIEIGKYCSQAKVQAYDVIFAEPKNKEPEAGLDVRDDSFAEFAHSFDVVVGVGVLENARDVHKRVRNPLDLPIPSRYLAAVTGLEHTPDDVFSQFTMPHNDMLVDKTPGLPSDILLGHVRSERDEMGVMRTYHPFLPVEGASEDEVLYLPSLGLRAVAKALDLSLRDISVHEGHLQLGTLRVPCDESGGFLFSESISDSNNNYPLYAAGDILTAAKYPLQEPEMSPDLFKDKIVLFGSIAEGLHDRVTTPWRVRSGVEVHAEAMNTLLQQVAITKAPAWMAWLLAALLLALSAVPWFERPLRMTLFFLFALLALLLVAAALAAMSRLMIPMMPPLLALGLGSVAFGTNHWQRERRARRHHERLEASKQNFTDMLVHDLKNAITPVLMFVDFMRMHDHQVPQPVASRLVDDVDAASKNALRLVENLLDIRRIQEGRLPLHCDNFDLHDYIETRAADFAHVVERSGKKLVLENQVPANTVCRFDSVLFQRVLENLIWNAVKYGRTGKEIILRTAKTEDGGVSISLSNACPVLEADFIESMFDAFITGVDKGSLIRSTGLGLAFCKMAITEHGGLISATSPMPSYSDGLEIKIDLPSSLVIDRKSEGE